MKRTNRQIISMLIALMMILVLLPTTAMAGSGKVAQIGETTYTSLDGDDGAIANVEAGQTIKLLENVTLADDTLLKIMNKGTAEDPIILDLNGYTISGSNSKNGTNEDTTTPGGILWVYGSYVTLTDTSNGDEKGGIINTYEGSSAAYGLVIRSTESNVGAVTIECGVRIEVTGTTSTSARAIHFQNNTNTSGTLTLTIEDAKVTANKGLTVYASAGSGCSCMATINGGEFKSTGKTNTADTFSGSAATMTINGGTFYNWGTSAWGEVAKDHVICIAQPEGSDAFTVTIAAQAPDDYVALVDAVGSYRAICLTEGSDLYLIHNIQTPAGTNGSGRTIHVKKTVAYNFPSGKYYGRDALSDPENYILTLDLAEGVTLSGGMNLYSADITVTGAGSLAEDFAWNPAEGYEMIVTGENGLYSCRLTTGGGAELIKADGTSIVYKTVVNAIAGAKLNPGSTVKMLADYTNSGQVTLNLYNNVVADFTLDLNGYTYTYSGSSDAITVNSGATLTVTDNSENGGGAIVTKGARETFIANSALATTGTGGTIIIEEGATVKNLVLLDAPNSKLTVAGTIDTTGFNTYAISGNGSDGKGGTEITIKETAVIISDATVAAPAIYHPQSGTLTVEGGTITGYGGIQMCSGDLVITGDPTITATGSDNTANKTGDGGIPDGAAISVVNRNYPGGEPTVTITGTPTVSAASGVDAVQAYAWSSSSNSSDTWRNVGDYINISGGTFTRGDERSELPEEYYPTGALLMQDENGTVILDNTKTAVAEVKGVKYASLQNAINAASDGDTVTLLTNITVESGNAAQTSAAIIINKSITLDGNGKSIAAASGFGDTSIINVENSSEVTIKNLSVNGAGSSRHGINIFGSSEVTLENVVTTGGLTGVTIGSSDVTIKGADTNIANGSWNVAVNLDSKSNPNDASLTVEDGTIGNIYIENTSGEKEVKAEIKGGNIENVGIATNADSNKTSAEISGGTFSNSVAEYVISSLNYEANNNGTYTYHATLAKALAAGGKVKSLAAAQNDSAAITVALVEGSSKTEIKVTANEIIVLPVRTDYGYNYFQGWSDGSKIYQGGVEYTVAGDVTLTAQWVYIPPVNPNPANAITTNPTANGTLGVTPSSAAQGTTVVVTPAANAGYELTSLTVVDANGNLVALTANANGTYSFTMPNSRVTVSATFSKIAPKPLPFVDVADSAWYADAVRYVYEKGLMTGATNATFEPETATTRGMLVTILYRLEGEPAAGTANFTDVSAGMYYAKAVAWAAANDIVTGYNGAFDPDSAVTREQMAAILYRYAAYKGYDVTARADLSSYRDHGEISAYAVDAMRWTNAEGLITGVTTDTLVPTSASTRAVIATILMRFCENVAK